MVENKPKTAEQRAEEAVTKKLGNAIACRMLKIRRYQASIKKLEREIKKIKEGELVPEDEEDDGDESPFNSCGCYKKKEPCREKIIERERVIREIGGWPNYVDYGKYVQKTPPYTITSGQTSIPNTTYLSCSSGLFGLPNQTSSTSLSNVNTLFPKKK